MSLAFKKSSGTFRQSLVIDWVAARWFWTPRLQTDGRPVGRYLCRTDAALAGAPRLSRLTALSASDFSSCHPLGAKFPCRHLVRPFRPSVCHVACPACRLDLLSPHLTGARYYYFFTTPLDPILVCKKGHGKWRINCVKWGL